MQVQAVIPVLRRVLEARLMSSQQPLLLALDRVKADFAQHRSDIQTKLLSIVKVSGCICH